MTSMVDYSKDKGLPETVGKYLIHAMALGDIIEFHLEGNHKMHPIMHQEEMTQSYHFKENNDISRKDQ
ncbi:hypothetical protein CEXT_689721 [Caerostris extrusa]|uniref:Uncharacterized protein n=1 Tax=Caerostris extrusa TaxID=172846 RepID=A0AAV4X9P8_CAEEX|nr:hypothetical protein CEXT_689721 [Caerostris extrusa]